MTETLSLWGLFISAFVSSTLFPGGSEVVVAMLTYGQQHDPWLLLGIATLGNTLGGMSTWLLGWLLARRYPPEHIHAARHAGAIARIRQWGAPVLLLSWLPLIGDPLCFAAGWLRINVLLAMIFIAIGKAARYAVIVFLIS